MFSLNRDSISARSKTHNGLNRRFPIGHSQNSSIRKSTDLKTEFSKSCEILNIVVSISLQTRPEADHTNIKIVLRKHRIKNEIGTSF